MLETRCSEAFLGDIEKSEIRIEKESARPNRRGSLHDFSSHPNNAFEIVLKPYADLLKSLRPEIKRMIKIRE